jgi:hypothetical protein
MHFDWKEQGQDKRIDLHLNKKERRRRRRRKRRKNNKVS